MSTANAPAAPSGRICEKTYIPLKSPSQLTFLFKPNITMNNEDNHFNYDGDNLHLYFSFL